MNEALTVEAVDIMVACRVPSKKDTVYVICEYTTPVLALGDGTYPPAMGCDLFSLEPQKDGTVVLQNIASPGEGTPIKVVGTDEAWNTKSKKGVIYALVFHGGEPSFWLGNGKDVIVESTALTIERSSEGLVVRVQHGYEG